MKRLEASVRLLYGEYVAKSMEARYGHYRRS
jgi:hypothetical protein